MFTVIIYDHGHYYYTIITGKSGRKTFSLYFFKNDLNIGIHNFTYFHDPDSSGIQGQYCDLDEMIDPESEPDFYSISGIINITTIDTGTYEGDHGVFINLEGTFNFKTDSIHGDPKNIENGKVSFHRY